MIVVEKPQKITIEVLAGMMNRSFEHLEGRMDHLEEKIDKVDKKVDGVIVRLEIIENKVDTNNENRISRIEDDMRVIKTKLKLQ